MSDIIHLETESPTGLEVRDLEKREIVGRIIPYGEVIQVRGKPESFAKGALADIKPNDSIFLYAHDSRDAIGRMTGLEEREDGAYATFKVAKTPRGDDMLQLAAEGVLNSLSAGFIPGTQTRDGTHTRIKSMPEVSLVPWGAYSKAEVLAVRSEEEHTLSDTPETAEVVAEAIDLGPLEQRMGELADQIQRLQVDAAVPEIRTSEFKYVPADWFVAEVEAQYRNSTERRDALMASLETRAIADAVGTFGATTNAGGLITDSYLAAELVSVLDARRPFFRRLGALAGGMPRGGVAVVPKITQHTNVGVRSAQAAEPTSRALLADTDSYTAKWYDGALQVSYELLQTAEVPMLQSVFDDLLGIYAQVTEAAAITDVEAAITVSAADLSTTSYVQFATAVATQAMAVRAATGLPATKLAVPNATWPALVAFIDGNDRRQFTSGDHSDGVLAYNAESFTLPGGIEVFAAGVTNPIIYNEAAVKVAEQPPFQLEATNIVQMMRDVAILGRTLIVPRIPAGIIKFETESSSSSS